jgi:hypothetical protein
MSQGMAMNHGAQWHGSASHIETPLTYLRLFHIERLANTGLLVSSDIARPSRKQLAPARMKFASPEAGHAAMDKQRLPAKIRGFAQSSDNFDLL